MDKAIDDFLLSKRVQGITPGSIKFYKKRLVPFRKWCQEHSIDQVVDLKPAHLRQFFTELEDKGNSSGHRHTYFRSLKTFLYWYEDEYEPKDWKNPIRKVKAPFVELDPLQPVAKETLDALLATCGEDWSGVRDRAILFVLYETGLRAQELCDLELNDVEPDGSILVKSGKGRKSRYVFIGKTVQKALEAWSYYRGDRSSPLFKKDDGMKMQYSTLRQMVRRRAMKAEIHPPALHAFRRSFALRQLQLGTDLVTLSKFMGHTTIALLARYSAQTKTDLKAKFRSLLDGDD